MSSTWTGAGRLVSMSGSLLAVVMGELVSQSLVVPAHAAELGQGSLESPAERLCGGPLLAGDGRMRPRWVDAQGHDGVSQFGHAVEPLP
jgi:hypothetical protein